MPVPDFQSFMLPLLKRSADGQEHPTAYYRAELAGDMGVSPEDLKERLPRGVQTKYDNRVYWALSYLYRAGCLERVRRGVFQISPRGQRLLTEEPSKITINALSQFPEFRAFHQLKTAAANTAPASLIAQTGEPDDAQTPEERLETSYQSIQDTLANEVLEAVKKMTPESFEQLVVTLLVAMGYGGSIQDAGKAVGKAGDEGIDGIIKEDKLGLDTVYIQAKKWLGSAVGRPVVQAFAGSLEGHRRGKAS